MPQKWGMGKGLQNVVNQWVNVNNNHVVFPEDTEGVLQQGTGLVEDAEDPHNVYNSIRTQNVGFNAVSTAPGNRSMNGDSRNGGFTNANGSVQPLSVGSSYNDSSFPYGAGRNQIPVRQSVQRTKAKLKKTNSQSDLLLERAALRRNVVDKRSNIDSISISSEKSSQKLPLNTGQYVNEIAFANQHRSKQLAAQKSDPSSKDNTKRRGTSQLQSVSGDVSDVSSFRSSIPESMKLNAPLGPLPSVSSANSLSERSGTKSRTPSEAAKSLSACATCEENTTRLLALEADLEYLRSAALNSEHICQSCERRNNSLPMNSASSVTSGRSVKSNRSRHSKSSSRMMDSSAHSLGTKSRKSRPIDTSYFNENVALAESSQRLMDVTSRHKSQIEMMSKEMARWKNEMHLKLSKLAMMCKDLNDESAKRKELVDIAKEDLSTVREERNSLASELDILRTRVALYEKQEAENVEIRRLLLENENETLTIADQAILQRDAIIEDLTTRLNKSMDLLDKRERDS